MNDTAISNPTNAIKIAIGNSVTKNSKIPLVNAGYRKLLKIFNKVCPATIFANSRTPKLNARAKYEINSIKASKGTNANGVPAGTKKLKKWIPCRINPNVVTPMKIVTLNPIATIALDVNANE